MFFVLVDQLWKKVDEIIAKLDPDRCIGSYGIAKKKQAGTFKPLRYWKKAGSIFACYTHLLNRLFTCNTLWKRYEVEPLLLRLIIYDTHAQMKKNIEKICSTVCD